MKKIIGVSSMLIVFLMCIFNITSYAESLTAIDIKIDKTIVRPGENVTVNINFGQALASYTFNVMFDDNIFDFVSAEGGTAKVITDNIDGKESKRVKVVYFDEKGGLTPRNSMTVIFKAKSDITTSNSTEFNITATGLADENANDIADIGVPITKNIVVEPEYVDYQFSLEYTGDILKGKEKEMKISYFSPIGRYYEKARLVVEVTTPEGANVQILGTDENKLEHNLVQSGWGEEQGYEIGGKDYKQPLNVRGIFSDIGDYSITLKLIDRGNSDQKIASKTFNVKVIDPTAVGAISNTENTTQNKSAINNTVANNTTAPTELPKTGNNIYIVAIAIITILLVAYTFYNKKQDRI